MLGTGPEIKEKKSRVSELREGIATVKKLSAMKEGQKLMTGQKTNREDGPPSMQC